MMRREGPRKEHRRRDDEGEARFEAKVGRYYQDLPYRQVIEGAEAELAIAARMDRTWTPEQIEMLENMGVSFVDFEWTPDDGGDAA